MKRILDLHTYILPAMTDRKGPQSMAESVQMVLQIFFVHLRLMS